MKDDDKTLDRRRFLKVAGAQTGLLVAATSGAGALAQQQQPQQPTPRRAPAVVGQKSPDIAVIGAGAFGGWTAYHLRKMGVRSSYGDRPHGVLWARWATEAMSRWREWDAEFARTTQERVFYTTGDLIF